jgi:pyruvate kinase
MARTKIVCTLGPTSSSPEVMRGLVRAGMDVARINFSHGDHETHAESIATLRRVAGEEGHMVSVMADLQGPKLRVGEIKEGPLELAAGDIVTLTTGSKAGDRDAIPVPHPQLLRELKPGQAVLLDDGHIELSIIGVSDAGPTGRVVVGGKLDSCKGINVPGVALRMSALTEKDQVDAAFALRQGVDFVALSFVRRAADVRELREFLKEEGGIIPIVAKIEKPEAIDEFDEILEEADGIMVARGDLGVETRAEDVPFLQKHIIRACNRVGKPVITATQMLQSMIEMPRPTRAEASDVANAVLDGTDAVMLSGETAIGQYPVQSAGVMEVICSNAEAHLPYGQLLHEDLASRDTITEAISCSAVEIAGQVQAKAIISATMSGTTARMVARHRPSIPIVAVTPSYATLSLLTLVWGVVPVRVEEFDNTDDMVRVMVHAAREEGVVSLGDPVVLLAGIPFGSFGETNMLKVHVVGELGRPLEV